MLRIHDDVEKGSIHVTVIHFCYDNLFIFLFFGDQIKNRLWKQKNICRRYDKRFIPREKNGWSN